jgi:gamma-glutamyltranspeptidase/glutathione hydrolase
MVVSGHHLATHAGVRVLERGGNAIDAGVAAGICLCVLQSDMVNFAGVAPIMIYSASTSELKTISGLGPWPEAASVDYFIENFNGEIPEDIQRTVVPAAPDAWIQALKLYGTMSFEEVTRDAIYWAENGFPMHQFMSCTLKEEISSYKRWPSNAEIYLPKGRPPEPGEIFIQRDLADTIRKMVKAEQKKGFSGRDEALQAARDEFYKGEIAEAILDFHRKNDGLLSRDDLENFQSSIESPLKTTYKGYEIYSCRPWCQGPVLLQVLNILEDFNLKALGHNSPEYIHLVSEALKLVYSDREKFYGDPDFVDVPIGGLLSKSYAVARRALIDKQKAWTEMPPAGDPWKWQGSAGRESGDAHQGWSNHSAKGGRNDHWDTSYVCVVDKYGNAFSATPSDVSNTTPIIPHTGLAVSSRGSQSWVDRNHPSSVHGRKRPRLTPNPSMVFEKGKLFMPFGTPGGDTQCQSMLQVFLNIVEFQMDPQEAVEAPRFVTYHFPNSFYPHSTNLGLLKVERRVEDSAFHKLKEKGHKIEKWSVEWAWKAGGVCAIVVDSVNGLLLGAADPRRESHALGW